MNTFVTTPQEALTAIAEQDSNLKQIKWAVKVRNTSQIIKDRVPPMLRNKEKKRRIKRKKQKIELADMC